MDQDTSDRLRKFIADHTKRSSYGWSIGGQYTDLDFKNEGKLELAGQIMSAFFSEDSLPTSGRSYVIDEESKTVLFVGTQKDSEYALCKYINDGYDAYLVDDIDGYAVTAITAYGRDVSGNY